jgi:hypothetical protein
MAYKEGFQFLADIGLLEVVLPFFLVFTITYAVLQRTQVFGLDGTKPKTKLNAMVAFVMGFFAVLATNLLNILNIMLFYFVLLLVIILLLALIFGLSGGEIKSRLFIGITIFFAGLFLFFALAKAGFIDENAFWTGFAMPMLILGVIVYGIFYFFKEEKPGARRETPRREQPRPAPRQGPTPQQIEELNRQILEMPPEQRAELEREMQRRQGQQ